MDEVKAGRYQKKLVSSSSVEGNAKSEYASSLPLLDVDAIVQVLEGQGKIIEAEEIRFDQVPLITPNGDVLVKSMSFNVEPGVCVYLRE